jgi:hypothetical protein
VKTKKKIRNDFREAVFERDGYCCRWCGSGPFKENTNQYLDAHHITDRNDICNGGYVKENGISLCKEPCHMKAEKFHISGGQVWEENMHPNDLYELIGSSYELAVEKSKRL